MNLVQVSDQELMEVDGGLAITGSALLKLASVAGAAETATYWITGVSLGRSAVVGVTSAVQSARETGRNSTGTGMSRRRARRR